MVERPEQRAEIDPAGLEKFRELTAAEDDVERILREIDELLRSGKADRLQLEEQVLREHAPRLEQAAKKSREALEAWLTYVKSEASKE